jgi:hypothetical protein
MCVGYHGGGEAMPPAERLLDRYRYRLLWEECGVDQHFTLDTTPSSTYINTIAHWNSVYNIYLWFRIFDHPSFSRGEVDLRTMIPVRGRHEGRVQSLAGGDDWM